MNLANYIWQCSRHAVFCYLPKKFNIMIFIYYFNYPSKSIRRRDELTSKIVCYMFQLDNNNLIKMRFYGFNGMLYGN